MIRARRPRRTALVVALVAIAALLAAGPAAADDPSRQPPFGAERPPPLERVGPGERPAGFELSAREALSIADRAEQVVAEREESPRMRPVVQTRGADRWQIDYFDPDGTPVAQAVVDDTEARVLESWRDHQVEVELARGYEDAVAGNVSEAWIWIPLCLLFALPFVDPRRPLRLLHLDLLVLLAFSVSSFFFNKGEITISVPLVYPVLAYLFARLLWAGFRPRDGQGPLIPLVPIRWLLIAAVALAVGRIALNVVDSQVIDIGFAGVVGADRIASGEGVYDGAFTPLIDRGDSYGPFNYLLYVPFEAIWPWGGGLESLPAAHAVAICFDLLTAGLLLWLGQRLRSGRAGRELGVALAFAWLAYPYTLYALNANGNDAVVAALLVAALIAVGSPLGRGALLGLAAAAKFGPLALAPLFAAGEGGRRLRSTVLFGLAFVVVWAVVLVPLLPDGGLREFYDRTLGYQASRGSPFSVWGLAPSLEPLQTATRIGAVVLGLALFLVPRHRGQVEIAALAAALLIALQAGSEHWFYFFIIWFLPYALVAFFAPHAGVAGEPGRTSPLSAGSSSRAGPGSAN